MTRAPNLSRHRLARKLKQKRRSLGVLGYLGVVFAVLVVVFPCMDLNDMGTGKLVYCVIVGQYHDAQKRAVFEIS